LWSVVLAPLPQARWLWIKAVPLAILAPGVMRGARRPRQWVALLAPLYFAEAIVRALTEGGRHGVVAATAAALALVLFVAVIAGCAAASFAGRFPAAWRGRRRKAPSASETRSSRQ
jgi:uncharacterized membrane protein